MAEFPALPLFTDAYLADTRHLSTEEHGAYLLLLMCAWRTRGCALKDDDRFLARIAGVSAHRWRRLKPVLREFFDISDGRWRQKKLQDVYHGVETRVAKNRANGARGGRAKAAKDRAERQATGTENATGGAVPAKTRIQTPKAAAAALTGIVDGQGKGAIEASGADDAADGIDDALISQLAAAAGLPPTRTDASQPALWLAAGASLVADILPTIARLRARQEQRTGTAPASLAYYSAAILDARDRRLGAAVKGGRHAKDRPASPPKQAFGPADSAHWRTFLGDSAGRFRGDYLSANWVISRDNPHFLARPIGCDPRTAQNPLIPADIYQEYGEAWGWCRPQTQPVTGVTHNTKTEPSSKEPSP